MCELHLGAINVSTNEYVHPTIANKNDQYICPDCGQKVIIKQGNIRLHHFSHEPGHYCPYYTHPTETQIHNDAKLILKSILKTKNIAIERVCKECKNHKHFQVEQFEHDSSVHLEYKFNYNNTIKQADVAYLKNDTIKYIFEIYHTHRTDEFDRPEPWFELDASSLIRTVNGSNNGELLLTCVRQELSCVVCVENEKKRQEKSKMNEIRFKKEQLLREQEKEKFKKEQQERKKIRKEQRERDRETSKTQILNGDLVVQILDWYRCLDTIDYHGDDDDDEDNEDGDEVKDLYSKEKQKELSKTHSMLIKAFGILENGKSITINLQGFKPFYYIKIPDDWTQTEYRLLANHIRSLVYYRHKEHLIKVQLVLRKPFSEFTGTQKFKFLKLQFTNKEAYDQYAYKLANPLKINGLCDNKPHKYDLYESNIDPILKLIHMTKINPSGWVKIPATTYQLVRDRTTLTAFEVKLQWDQIQPYDKLENAHIKVVAFDLEANSSHGDFPIGIKNYQKLSQDLVTLYNECGIQTKKTHIHPLFQKSPKDVIHTALRLVFDDNYNNNNIHQIHTIGNLKPHPDTVQQIGYIIDLLMEHDNCNCEEQDNCEEKDDCREQLVDLFEHNLPTLDTTCERNSDYSLLAEEITAQLSKLTKSNNQRFKKNPIEVIVMMINLAFEDFFDGFIVSNIYTKNNLKPDSDIISALVPNVVQILQDCANFINFKKISENVLPADRANLSQDYFVTQLTALFDQHLPPVEGDQLIQIGSTFQITGQHDCDLKHIICLHSCDPITNEEMIKYENKDIYLPAEELAHDLVMYEQQLGGGGDPTVNEVTNDHVTNDQVNEIIKKKIKEVKTWDIPYRKQQCQKAAEYRRIKQSTTDHAKVVVECYDNEKDVLLAWKRLILRTDPDVVIGYNIFGFDFKFMYERSTELNCAEEFCQLGRLKGFTELFYEQKLSSAGLGDNTLRYIPMKGRVIIDLYKVVQKEYKLDSYKLDSVCHKFLYKEKVDLPPTQIFNLQKGSALDRKTIATYCLVDCILCNRLVTKLEIINNNIAMANVCKVPFPYLFLRGQGVKIFSLVADACSQEGFLIPVLPKTDPENDDKYEGAIVLTPDTGIHFEPIVVGDFNSLYPSSMISENISHDSYVQIGGQYDNLPGYTYTDIEYDVYQTTIKPGTKKKKIKTKVGTKTCRYAQLPDNKKSIIPTILMKLLSARKTAKNKMDEEKDPYKAKLWNGLQLAYKVTANSVYGQCGAKTSPISKVDLAASTTAVGRRMIIFSKTYIEKAYKDTMVTLDVNCSGIYDPKTKTMLPTKYTGMTVHVKDSYCVYGDTDSVFIKFNMYTPQGDKITGLEAVSISIALCKKAVKEISSQLKKPQNIEFEKAIYPFIIISKKRYHGHYYTKIDNPSFEAKSMGIALKRRDNAPVVKHIFGGAVDIIMNDHDVSKALEYVKTECNRLLKGQFPLEEFVISKTLKSYYKKPRQIAHNVLACRQAQRDPGNRFEPNDRVPYAFVVNPTVGALQGDRIETPEFICRNKLTLDYHMYITHQVMVPVSQIFNLVPGFEDTEKLFTYMMDIYENERTGNISLDKFIKKKTTPIIGDKLYDLIAQSRKEIKDRQTVTIDEETDDDVIEETDEDEEVGEEGTSNYDDPNF